MLLWKRPLVYLLLKHMKDKTQDYILPADILVKSLPQYLLFLTIWLMGDFEVLLEEKQRA